MIGETFARNPSPAPPWTKDMVIYEVNPRTLATDHFYGVWSVYATWRPDQLDPALGSESEFSAMVRSAHEHGIRILLDVISHGVIDGSPLVSEHPKWFSGRSWGMTDYDYENPEFRDWWVNLWVSYVERFDIDGYRVDLHLQDPELWDQVTARCAGLGHDIVVMPEAGRYHLGQRDTLAFSPDVAADWSADPTRFTTVQVSCHDAGWLSKPGNHYRVRGSRSAFGYSALLGHRVPLFFAGEEFDAGQHGVPKLRRGLFGAGGPGGWLYGSALDWSELENAERALFHADVRRLLQIRQHNSDVINADHRIGDMVAVPVEPALPLVPYLRRDGQGSAVLVVGNEDDKAVTVSLELPLERIGVEPAAQVKVTDLVSGEQSTARTSRSLTRKVTIPGDHEPGGGVAVLRFDPV